MPPFSPPNIILIAEDDEDDYISATEALKAAGVDNKVHWCKDGEELMGFLNMWVKGGQDNLMRPGVIILDLHMPKKNGLEVLEEIKSHPVLRKIPVVMMTTSIEEEKVGRIYELGVHSFFQKPIRFYEFGKVIKIISLSSSLSLNVPS